MKTLTQPVEKNTNMEKRVCDKEQALKNFKHAWRDDRTAMAEFWAKHLASQGYLEAQNALWVDGKPVSFYTIRS